MAWVVNIADRAQKHLLRMPHHIVLKLNAWIRWVETRGLMDARKIPGFHDEPLKGRRRGQRSIRLSLAYRAIYTVGADGGIDVVRVEEVTRHEY